MRPIAPRPCARSRYPRLGEEVEEEGAYEFFVLSIPAAAFLTAVSGG